MEIWTHFYTIPPPAIIYESFSEDLCMIVLKSLFSSKFPLDFPSDQCIIIFIFVKAMPI